MSYEKKIKDLMARLASMSPEPPPYPEEESPMARHQTKKERRPALVFAGALALVVLLAVPLLLFTGGEDPFAVPSSTTTTTTIVDTTTSVDAAQTTTTTTDTTESTQVLEPIWESLVYLFQTPENSFLGNPALIPVWIRVEDPTGNLQGDDYFTEALPLAQDLPPGLESAVPPAVRIEEVEIAGDSWVVDMNEAFLDGAGGLLADVTMLNQIIYTITYGTPEFEDVLFTVQGQPVTAYGSEGMDLSDPVTRETFIEDLHAIFLTEPVRDIGGPVRVQGRANTFEASLMAAVVDGEGEAVVEQPVAASCGSGCWGDFEAVFDSEIVEPGQSSIRLFQYSAEDGSVIDAITVPVPSGDVWELTP